ncbi:hypothetical protein Droror1_Dr00000122 [Drosera rotundifolia]
MVVVTFLCAVAFCSIINAFVNGNNTITANDPIIRNETYTTTSTQANRMMESESKSINSLKQEREHLAKRVSTKLTPEEREMYYMWEIPPKVKQKRRLQLVNKLWSDPRER